MYQLSDEVLLALDAMNEIEAIKVEWGSGWRKHPLEPWLAALAIRRVVAQAQLTADENSLNGEDRR